MSLAQLLLLGFSIRNGAEPARFTGEWRAEHNGTAFVVLDIEDRHGLKGRLRQGAVSVDREGHVVAASAAPAREQQLKSIEVKRGRLLFKVRGKRGQTIAYQLITTGPGSADLTVKDMPAEMKPIQLVRQ